MLGFKIWKFTFIIINFAVLYFLLQKIFFKRLMDVLEQRRQNVSEAVAKIDHAKAEVEEIKRSGEDILIKAKEEAKLITKNANKTASDIIAKAKQESEKYIQETRSSIEKEREEIRQEMYSTLIDLVSMASRKVMAHVMSDQDQQKLVEFAVNDSLKQASMQGSE